MTKDELIKKIDITKKAIMFAGLVHRQEILETLMQCRCLVLGCVFNANKERRKRI